MRIQSLVDTAAQAVNTAIARGAGSYPSVDMARDGYVIESAFLPAVETELIMREVERFADRTVMETGVPGSKVTDRSNSQRRDLNVRVLDGAQHLSPARPVPRSSPTNAWPMQAGPGTQRERGS